MLQDLLDVGQLMHSIGGLCRIVVDGASSPWLQGCRATETSSEREHIHAIEAVLEMMEYMQWVGSSMVKVYRIVYYGYDKYNAMQSGFVSLMGYMDGHGLRVRAEIQYSN
jgi:hypothetical protein